MALDSILKPKKEYDLIRLGGSNDGGYLIGYNSIIKSQKLITFGVGENWEFEKDFLNKNKNCKIFCYDHKPILKHLIRLFFISLLFLPTSPSFKFLNYLMKIFNFFKTRKKINFITKHVSYGSLDKLLTNNLDNNIFLKIDIEGSEYRLLEEIIKHEEKFIGLIIEFHNADIHKKIIHDFFIRFNLKLTHIHSCNCGQLDANGDPLVFELTFEKDPKIIGEHPKIPNKLDMKNNPKKQDIQLFFN